jgi:hypothetical protein
MKYNINDHIHLYAVWTAARAVQRGFTTTEKIKAAIETTGMRAFAEKPLLKGELHFKKYHQKWAGELTLSLKAQKVDRSKLTYGRMAKIISVYLKTSVILPAKGKTAVCRWIHPPIDAILLKELARVKGIKELEKLRWTLLDEKGYWELCELILAEKETLDWRLEKYWTPDR